MEKKEKKKENGMYFFAPVILLADGQPSARLELFARGILPVYRRSHLAPVALLLGRVLQSWHPLLDHFRNL
jgi:hypothetical protein